MKRGFLLLLILFFLASCSSDKEQETPNDRFDAFATYWNEQDFNSMYDLFSSNTKENVTKEDSVERYEKIYEDLHLQNVEISFNDLTEEQLETIEENDLDSTTIPFSAEMDSLAGPIEFDYEATLILEQDGSEEDAPFSWFVEWDPGFIFPDLKDGGEITVQTVDPERGEILDRNQMPLAMNDTVYEIGIVPGELDEPASTSIDRIANILNMDADTIKNELSADWVEDHLFVPITTILPSNETVYEEIMQIPGIQRMEVNGRIYPGNEATSHLTGYIGDMTAEILEELDNEQYGPNDQVGRRGLEQLFEERLKGKKGRTIQIVKENGEETTLAEKPVEHGENISLTIDINIQQKIYNSFGDDAGTAATIDPKTGETLALVSAPAFDSNEILYSTSGDLWNNLENDEQTPLINRFAATYAPGSVIKPISAAIGMADGSLDPNATLDIEEDEWSNGEGWGDYQVTRVSPATGPVDLKDAMERSDNIYFAMQAVNMSGNSFASGLETFGFEEALPYEYPITSSSISNSGELNDEVLLANSSYGQGELETSALHLTSMYTPFLNEGDMIKPTLLLDEDTEQIWEENIISADDADIMNDILRSVVTDGTGSRAEEESDIPIAGKTGTVELKLSADESGSTNSWFVSYPYESQDILIALMVEETQDKENGIAIGKSVEIINDLYNENKDEE